jgi:hypothetical protein
MKVRELIEKLSEANPEAEVQVADMRARSECYRPATVKGVEGDAKDAVCSLLLDEAVVPDRARYRDEFDEGGES